MLTKLFKLATELDQKGLYSEADEIDQAMKLMAERAGVSIEDLISLANDMDVAGLVDTANSLDELVKAAAKKKTEYKTFKGKGEKPPAGAKHKAPKGWFDKMKKDLKKKNPDYSAKRISEIIGDIWDNELTDAKRKSVYKRYGKTKSPNK